MKYKFRGKRVDNGEYVYGDLKHMTGGRVGIHFIPSIACVEVDPESVSQRITYDKIHNGLYDGDEIRIDFEGAAKVIGEGMLLKQIEATKPTSDAKLKIKWEHYRYRLIWSTPNGSSDTGIDMALLEPILPYVEVAS